MDGFLLWTGIGTAGDHTGFSDTLQGAKELVVAVSDLQAARQVRGQAASRRR
jgi:hypothetical protein